MDCPICRDLKRAYEAGSATTSRLVPRYENFRRVERQYGEFTRSFTLPSSVDLAQVSRLPRPGACSR